MVSFVLFQTPLDEVAKAVDQVLRSGGNYHVVLVDNSVPSLDLPQYDSRVTVIRTARNLGYGTGHNRAFALPGIVTRYHFVVNTDVTYEPDALPELIAFMDRNPAVGLAMPRVTYPDGTLQHLCRLLPAPLDVFGRGFFGKADWVAARNKRYEFHDWGYDRVESFPFLSGCFMALRTSTLEQVGGFDERFFLYAEDLDLSRRIYRVARTAFVPEVTATHEYRTKGSFSFRRLLYRLSSLTKYFNKYGWFVDQERTRFNRETVARVFKPQGRPV